MLAIGVACTAVIHVLLQAPAPPPKNNARVHHDHHHHVTRDENIYALRESAWNKTLELPLQAWDCFEGAFYKFKGHGCCAPNRYSVNFNDFGLDQLFEQWRNKRVVFIGDSITQQYIDALLSSAYTEGIQNITARKGVHKDVFAILKDYNATLERIGNGGGLSPINGSKIAGVTYPDTVETFEEAIMAGDIVYLNFGLHLAKVTLEDTKLMLLYARRILEDALKRNPAKRHYFRLTLPQHFFGKDGRGSEYRNRSNNSCVGLGVDTTEHWTSAIARDAFRGSSVSVLDYSAFLEHRGDLHSNSNPGDCSHWCYDYAMWRGIWFLMYRAGL